MKLVNVDDILVAGHCHKSDVFGNIHVGEKFHVLKSDAFTVEDQPQWVYVKRRVGTHRGYVDLRLFWRPKK